MTTSVTDEMILAALQAYISEAGTVDSRDGDLLHIDHEGMRSALEAALRSQGKVVNTGDLIALREEVRVQASMKDHYADWEETERMFTAIIGEGD